MSQLATASREALSEGGALANQLDNFVPREAQQRLVQGPGSVGVVACGDGGACVLAQVLYLRIAQGLHGEFAIIGTCSSSGDRSKSLFGGCLGHGSGWWRRIRGQGSTSAQGEQSGDNGETQRLHCFWVSTFRRCSCLRGERRMHR